LELDKPIRVQGKNGVLKIMVNKKRHTGLHPNTPFTDGAFKKELQSYQPSLASTTPTFPENNDKKFNGKVKKLRGKSFKEKKSAINGGLDSDTDGEAAAAFTVRKEVKKREEEEEEEEEVEVEVEEEEDIHHSFKTKDSKLKRSGSTEKQMLREKIRGMLIDCGWKIEHRPRRNRDYLDAVYINPNGTAYWSIIKAYEALKKQLEDDTSKVDVSPSSSFAPLSEDLINKLTRQTKKKIEEEMKRKRKEEIMNLRPALRDVDGDSSSGSDHDLSNFPSEGNPSKSSSFLQVQPVTASPHIGGKRTILGWLIDSGIVQLSEKVQYMNRKRSRVMLEGWITRDGIHCRCCSKILTVSKFELHAGSKLKQPFHNVFLESGSSLSNCQIEAWNKQRVSGFHKWDDPDDDICSVCWEGGDLICCDNCPSTFHQHCLDLEMAPSSDWMCPRCRCKVCGSEDELLDCGFCTESYHRSCCGDRNRTSTSQGASFFCGIHCQEMYDQLQKMVGIRHEADSGFSWSLLQRASSSFNDPPSSRVECNSKLAVAFSVVEECLSPVIDQRSGINILRNVVYSIRSNFKRLDFGGFFTAVLEKGDEIISAACIRIHGRYLAEMPFLATRNAYRRQGMSRRLLAAVETLLLHLGVEHLIAPVFPEQNGIWISGFGFGRVDDELRREMKSTNLLVLPGTHFLQKKLMSKQQQE
ncbi:hypothetical protein M569_03396, partial [Genlisea aurea]